MVKKRKAFPEENRFKNYLPGMPKSPKDNVHVLVFRKPMETAAAIFADLLVVHS